MKHRTRPKYYFDTDHDAGRRNRARDPLDRRPQRDVSRLLEILDALPRPPRDVERMERQ